MSSMKLAVIPLAFAVISAGCSTVPIEPPKDEATHETQFICGARQLNTRFTGDKLFLTIDDHQPITLQQARAASGARYVGHDDKQSIEFWNKGRFATLSMGEHHPIECLQYDFSDDLYQAQGQEPGWQFTQADDAGLLITDYGANQYYFPELKRHQGHISAHNRDDELAVRIFSEICHDSMSGLPYPDRVELSINNERLNGCGGKPDDLLQDTHWQIKQINDQPLSDDIDIHLTFLEDGAVAGLAACNRFHGRYEILEHGLKFTPLATTMMACEEDLMRLEQRFLNQLKDNIGHGFVTPNRLKLFDAAGNEIIASKSSTPPTH